jgi:hypothetical protein
VREMQIHRDEDISKNMGEEWGKDGARMGQGWG